MCTRCHTQARPSYRRRARRKPATLTTAQRARPAAAHGWEDVLQDVGECSMATGVRKKKGGQLAQKNLRGAMRRSLRRTTRSNPLPPCLPVLARQNAFQQSKTPFHMICVVNCYGQPAQPQPLAMADQTMSVNSPLWCSADHD
jgi:hypothetical protein